MVKRNYWLLPLFYLMVCGKIQAQQNGFAKTSFSHFYFSIDSLAYNTLLTDTFCTKRLFHENESKSKMDQGSWSGNYILGKEDYWEILKPSPEEVIPEGGIGLGHMLHRPAELSMLQQQWQSLINDSIIIQPFTNNNGKDSVIIELMNYRDSMIKGGQACFFVMFYHPSVLKRSGLTDEAIANGVDQKTLNGAWYGPKQNYNRLYKRTEKIHLQLTPHEYARHRIALLAMGYKQTGKNVFKKEIEITITVKKKLKQHLQKIEFSLTGETAKRKIILSPHTYITLNGKKGTLVMK